MIDNGMEEAVRTLVMGILATIAIDIWTTFANKVLKLPRTNWAMVGRWIGHIPSGRFTHDPISASPPVQHELLIGWVFHYAIGVAYAALYVVYVVAVREGMPTLASAWIFGAITILSPWFVMQPALGLGFLAARAPQPNRVRLQNFVIHSIFGVALYYGWVATGIL
jgi:hypothetical protein